MKGEGALWESASQTRWNNDSGQNAHELAPSQLSEQSPLSEHWAGIPPDCLSSPMSYYSRF